MTDTTNHNVHADVRSIADKLKAGHTLDTKTTAGEGQISYKDGMIGEILPEGMTLGQVSAVHQMHSKNNAAHQLAAGEIAVDAFKKHKDLVKVESTLAITGRDSYHATVNRERTGRNPRDGSETHTYAAISGGMDLHAEGNRGEVKKVRGLVSDLGESLLGSKKK